MPEKRFNIRQVLRAFAIITQKGIKEKGIYTLEGIQASSADDGYTIELSDGQVTLHVFFHNSYDVDFDNEQQLDQFQLKIDAIEALDKAS